MCRHSRKKPIATILIAQVTVGAYSPMISVHYEYVDAKDVK